MLALSLPRPMSCAIGCVLCLQRSAPPMSPSAKLLPFCLLLPVCLCAPASAEEFDAITSAPSEKETPQTEEKMETPFFGEPVKVEEEPGRDAASSARKTPASDALEIPEEAAKKDPSFPERCWYFAKEQSPTLGMHQNYYCFNRNGKGYVYDKNYKYNKINSAPAWARIDENGDVIIENLGNQFFVRSTMRCKGTSSDTICSISSPHVANGKEFIHRLYSHP